MCKIKEVGAGCYQPQCVISQNVRNLKNTVVNLVYNFDKSKFLT